MNLASLRLIRDVAHLRSISKAAQAGEISQSAASQSLTDLERELGVLLFDRSTRPLTITPAGKLYVEFCRDVIRKEEEVDAQLDAFRQRQNGLARLAAIYSVGLSEMSQIEARFRSAFPHAELEISYLRPERVWAKVERGEADAGLISYAESSREVLAVAPEHPLANYQSSKAPELEGEAFIGFDDDLPIQSQIERYLRDYKVTVVTALHFDNLQMIKEAVAHGAGVSILPRRVMFDDVKAGRLVALRLEPAELSRPLYIIYRRRRVFNVVTKGLLALLKEEERANVC